MPSSQASLALSAFTLLAASAHAQMPAVVTTNPPNISSVPIAPGSLTEIGNGFFLDANGDIVANQIISRDGKVDVRNPQFATGCPNSADPLGKLDSTCAAQNAINWILANQIPGGGLTQLYWPHGVYKVGGTSSIPPHGTVFHLTSSVGFTGDGSTQSVLVNTHPSATTIQYDNAGCGSSLAINECQFAISHLMILGGGQLSTGDGIEAINTPFGLVDDVQINNFGGIGLNLLGGTERWIVQNSSIGANNRTILEEGDTNENNFTRVNVMTPGISATGYCYSSPTCIHNALPVPNSGATWRPSPRATVYLDGVKNQWRDSSIKALIVDGGIHGSPEAGVIASNYFEGYPYGNQPRLNFAVEAGGKQELSHTTTAMTATSMVVGIDDAVWTNIYVNSPGDVQKIGSHGGRDQYCIYPNDYLLGSTAASSAVPWITRGTRECLQVYAAAGDGNMYLKSRGSNPIAWPANSILEQTPPNSYGTMRIESNHLDSEALIAWGPQTFYDGCSDTTPLASWTGNPNQICATIVAGYVPDGYAVPYPTPALGSAVAPSYGVTLSDNATFNGGGEVDGLGITKVSTDAAVNLEGDSPLWSLQDIAVVQAMYVNGGNRIAYVNWNGVWATGAITDSGARAISVPSWGYFDAYIPQWGQGIFHQHTGMECEANMVPGTPNPTERTCKLSNGQSVTQDLVGGNWVNQPGTSRTYSYQVPNFKLPTAYAANPAGGHIENGQSSYCPAVQGAWVISAPGLQPNYSTSTWVTFNPPLPGGFTWNLVFNGYGASYGPASTTVPSANVWVQVCNTNPTNQTLPPYETVTINQLQ